MPTFLTSGKRINRRKVRLQAQINSSTLREELITRERVITSAAPSISRINGIKKTITKR